MAPKGIGALYIRPGVQVIDPVLHGGGHERGLRPGTSTSRPSSASGAPPRSALPEMDEEAARLTALRDHLARLADGHSDLCVNGSMAARLPQNLNISVPGVDPEMLGPVLDDLAVSTGSACSSGHDAPSTPLPWAPLKARQGVDSLWAGPMDDRRGNRVCHGTRHSRGLELRQLERSSAARERTLRPGRRDCIFVMPSISQLT